MKFVLTDTQRSGGSAADNVAGGEAAQKLLSNLAPSPQATIREWLKRCDGNGGFAVLETGSGRPVGEPYLYRGHRGDGAGMAVGARSGNHDSRTRSGPAGLAGPSRPARPGDPLVRPTRPSVPLVPPETQAVQGPPTQEVKTGPELCFQRERVTGIEPA